MNLVLTSVHMDTLKDLMNLSEKHDCYITMGCENSSSNEFDTYVLKKNNIDAKILKILEENPNDYIQDCMSTHSYVWFELHDKINNSIHRLTYRNDDISFKLTNVEDLYNFVNEDLVVDFISNLSQYDYEDVYFASFNDNSTIIHGFGNEKPIEDYRIYRSGMVLHSLSELICVYLKEPLIKRVY